MAQAIGFLVGFIGTFYAGYVFIWSGIIVPLVPSGDYHGLILLALAVVMFMVFGGFALLIASLIGAALGAVLGGVTGK